MYINFNQLCLYEAVSPSSQTVIRPVCVHMFMRSCFAGDRYSRENRVLVPVTTHTKGREETPRREGKYLAVHTKGLKTKITGPRQEAR